MWVNKIGGWGLGSKINGLDVAEEYWAFSMAGLMTSAASAGVIALGVDTGAVAGTYTLEAQLIGYLL